MAWNSGTGSVNQSFDGDSSGKSSIHHIFSQTQIIEKKTTRDQKIYLLFVDPKNAYDSVPLITLWKRLESTINIDIIKAVKTLYCETSYNIQW